MRASKIVAIVFSVVVLAVAGIAAYLLATFDAARLKQEIAGAVEKQTGRVLKIEGELALGVWPDVAVTLGRTTLSEPAGRGEFARLENARIAVAVMPLLSKQVVVKRIELDGFAASIIKRKDGSLNIADLLGAPAGGNAKVGAGETAPDTAAPPLALDIAGIRIANARIDWHDEQAGSSLSLADLDFSSGAVRMVDGAAQVESLALSVRGKRAADAFEAKFAASGIAGSARALKVEKFALDVDAKAGAARAVAKLSSPIAFDMEKQTVAMPRLAGQLDLTHPKLPMKTLMLPLSGAANADLAKQSASLRLDTKLDASTIAAKLDIGKFAPLALAFDIAIDTLDLDKYLPPEQQGTGSGAGKTPEAKIDLSVLKGLNLKGTAKIGQLTAAKVKASNINVRINAKDGRLNVMPLSVNLYDGRLDGSLAVDANGNRFAAKQHLAGVRIGPLLKDLADKDIVEGRGDVALDVTAHGGTVDALKKTLAGTARVALADGAVKGINIGQKLRDAKALLKGGKDANVENDQSQKTDFSELSASFRLANGVAHNDDLLAKSPLLRLTGAGDIDIGNSRLDYLAKASVVATGTGQGGKDLDKVKGVTLPIRLTGPFEKPAWKLELAGVVEEAAKARVEEKREEFKQKAEDKLKSKLKGLLR